jgi:DNA primase large subunit
MGLTYQKPVISFMGRLVDLGNSEISQSVPWLIDRFADSINGAVVWNDVILQVLSCLTDEFVNGIRNRLEHFTQLPT